jgi:hypothetical protein
MIKVISYLKNNELENLISGYTENKIEEFLKTREPEPLKIKNYKPKLGKIKYATKKSILESLVGTRKLLVKNLLKNISFNDMRIIN